MPIYEYQCLKCLEQVEVMQKMSDDPLTTCTACGGELKKMITNSSFVLKGSGWYVTDYPSDDRKKAMGSGKDACASSCAKAGTCPAGK
ncbi:MAG: zinc ribbon domain-containing protein [Nitrospira sp.]|nr:zinc ribbon domain-containing protein [bacterium]MBL7049124.1 zinc ribbon domain-containing protein [Nitrospira sp.]